MKLSLAVTPAPTVFAPLLYAGDLMRGLRRAAELGYDGVELNLRDPAAENLELIVSAAQAYGLAIVSLGTGQAYLVDGLSVAASDPEVRTRLIERIKRQIDFAARTGAQVVLGGVRGRFEGDAAARRGQYEGALDVVRQLADYAAPKRVTLTLEPINRYESNFINTVDDALVFLRDAGRQSVKVLIDTFHMNIEEADMCAAIEQLGPRLSHVHLVDSNRCAPGMGHVDFRSIIAALRAIGYDGYLSGEFLPLPNDDFAAEKNIAYVRGLLA
ncbi:MAG TPA: sugar phosphate isomerase/epimerase family protein [Anaerolineae bacterium]